MFSEPSFPAIDNDGDPEEMDHTHHTPTQNGGRIIYLKLKKARLESQVAFTRTQLLLAEMELQLMERDLQNEVKKIATPEPKTPTRPQTKRPHKFVKLLTKVFKPSNSNQNTEEPDTTASTLEIKEDLAKKRKAVEATGRSKKLESRTHKEYKKNINTSRSNKQQVEQEEADNSKKNRKDKKKSSEKKKKTVVETGIKEDNATEKKKHSDSNKKDTITNVPIAKHSSRPHKHEKGKERDDNNSKVDKGLKPILKKPCITEGLNNNLPENISPENTGEYEDSVELNIRTMFNSPLHSDNNMETTTVDKATSTAVQSDAFAEIRENVFIKETFFKAAEGDVVKVVDAMLYSLQNDELFKELRNIQVKTEKASSLGSLETLVLEEDCEERNMELFM